MTTQVLEDELIAHTNEDVAALFPEFHELPAETQLAPLRLPLCLPQGTSGMNSAFIRAYSPELQASGIEMDDWLRFIDGLNIAMVASPPLRVVELAGMAIGFVPYHWAVLAGAGIQAAARTGIYVIAKTLTDRYLKRANAEYFAPRGLRVRICKTAAMRQLVGRDPAPAPDASGKISASTKVMNFAVKSGRVVETAALHLPVVKKVYNRIAPPVPAIAPGQEGGMTARRLMELEGYVLPLSFDVPHPAPQEGIMNKASGLSLRLQTWRAQHSEAKVERKRQLLAIQEGRVTSRAIPASEANSSGQVLDAVLHAVLGTTLGQAHKDRLIGYTATRRAERGLVGRDLASKVEIADRIEYKKTRMLLWIVLLTDDQDAQIEGRELVDNDMEVEEIPEEEWWKETKQEISEDRLFLANEDESDSEKRADLNFGRETT